jgi:uridine kinase
MKNLIGIEGLPGSGKSYYATKLAVKSNCDVVCIDDFYLPKEKRNKDSFKKGGNNIDFNRFIKEVIIPFSNNEIINYSIYNCKLDSFTKNIQVNINDTLIIEGNYILRKELFKYFTYSYFIKADMNTIKKNIINRSSQEVFQVFKNKWIPLAQDYIKENDLINKVDKIIIKNTL